MSRVASRGRIRKLMITHRAFRLLCSVLLGILGICWLLSIRNHVAVYVRGDPGFAIGFQESIVFLNRWTRDPYGKPTRRIDIAANRKLIRQTDTLFPPITEVRSPSGGHHSLRVPFWLLCVAVAAPLVAGLWPRPEEPPR